MWPNHSLEPSPVGRSFAVDIMIPVWLSFGRWSCPASVLKILSELSFARGRIEFLHIGRNQLASAFCARLEQEQFQSQSFTASTN
jgi:hypothetical protein